ncbi:MAG: 30S ribosomal protein S6 [Nitrospirae bacterium]|nr:30S ribosomal protein S6 [Nitrospirota bacterium]
MVILNTALSDEDAEVAVGKIKELIANQGGEVLKVDVWGRRKLAYEIKKQKKGLYILLFFKTPTTTIKKLEEFYKVYDAVLKYLIVKLTAKQVRSLESVEASTEQMEQKSES